MHKETDNCLRTVKLLLCFVVLYCSSCSGLRIKDEISYSILKVSVCEQDFPEFMKCMKELNIKVIDVVPVVDDSNLRFSVLFRFTTKDEFLLGRFEILSTGLVKQIN